MKQKRDIYFEINNELSEFDNNIYQFEPRIRRVSERNVSRETINIKRQQQREQPTRHDRRVSKKSRISFRVISSHIKNQQENTQLHASNQEISSPIFLMLE